MQQANNRTLPPPPKKKKQQVTYLVNLFKVGSGQVQRVQAYFGRGKAASLCSYCCNRHLWFYNGGRLGRVKIVTFRVGASAKEGKGGGRGEQKIHLPDNIVLLGNYVRCQTRAVPDWGGLREADWCLSINCKSILFIPFSFARNQQLRERIILNSEMADVNSNFNSAVEASLF